MAGGHGGESTSGAGRWYRPMHGFHPHRPAFKHRWGAKLLGATMWFFIFYRAKQDGPVLLVSTRRATEVDHWDGSGGQKARSRRLDRELLELDIPAGYRPQTDTGKDEEISRIGEICVL